MDLDGDQWLDLVVLNYVHFDQNSQQYCDNGKGLQTSCPPKVYEPEFGVISIAMKQGPALTPSPSKMQCVILTESAS